MAKFSSPEQVRDVYRKANGVLFTGGGLGLELDSQYVKTAKIIYDSVISNKSDHVPMWGTLLLLTSLPAVITTLALRRCDACTLFPR